MRRQWLVIAVSFYAAACAQIAGFEQLSPKKQPSDAGAGGFAGAIASTSGGSSTPSGGTNDREGEGGNLGDAGSNVNIGNNAGATPVAGTGGSTAGSAGTGTGNAGSGGAEVVGGCNAQQLKNAHFDRGAIDWTQESTAPGILGVDDVILEKNSARLTTAQVAPKSGSYLAWLGGNPNSQQGTRVNLLQEVEIPEKISNLIVSGWIRIQTSEPVAAESNDQLDIALQDENDFWSFHVWYVASASDEWQPFEYEADDPTVLDALRGRKLTFIVESKTDTSFATHFWVDSLSFIAECP
jgi:hypothetical protein